MTILVLELHVPDARSSSELVAGLAAQAPSLFGFALSFAALGTYWVGNHSRRPWSGAIPTRRPP
ncbi:MAG: DUF1211 domain-containing protein [Chloroflexi bacterium]|nr:MAG: DUF1211 domain-containing protein [Chloroflexota bacterium]